MEIAMNARWQEPINVDDLWEGDMTAVTVDGEAVLLVNIDGTVRAYSNRCPHQASALDEGDLDGETLTCAQFRDRAERVAAGLHTMGVTAGSVVSWQLPTRIETVVLSMALARPGAVPNPIIHLYLEREVGDDWLAGQFPEIPETEVLSNPYQYKKDK